MYRNFTDSAKILITDSEVQGMDRNCFDNGFLGKMESNPTIHSLLQIFLGCLFRTKGSLMKVANYIGFFSAFTLQEV